jgi:glycosyltransferase involved in cell wall biosynthesis
MSQNKKPLISVLLPVYNGEKFLVAAIDSILNQTESNFELLCINDGSTDSSLKILKKYTKKDKRIRTLNNPKNIGMAASLNRALPLTRGKYIARMDADDISLPSRFAKQVELLESNPALVAVGGQEEIINEHSQVTAEKYFPTNSATCYQVLTNFMPIQPPLLMVRGSVFRKIHYNTKICKNDDINIYFKLLQFGQLSNCQDIIFQYRQLPSSLTHANAKKVFFMALKNRFDGIINYGFRPNPVNLFILLAETIFALIAPPSLIVKLFEVFRYRSASSLPATSSRFGLSPAKN